MPTGAERTQMAGGGNAGPGKSGNNPKKEQSVGKKVLSDVSVAQITASALAAVTAMLFSSQIGLAGSAIGVAASAAVTALSSQIYKSFITASSEKAKKQFNSDSDSGQTTVMPGTGASVRPGTTPLNADGTGAKSAAQPQSIYGTDRSKYSANSAKYSHKAAKSHKHAVMGSLDVTKKKWFAIVIMTVVGLLTVFITAHVINTATSGEGLGAKTAPIIRVSDTASSSSADQSNASADNQDSRPSSSSTMNGSSSSNGNTDANQGGNAASSSNTNGNGGNTANNGNTASSSSNGGTGYSSSSNTTASSSSSAAADMTASSSSNTVSSSSTTG
ncbi:MAG: hypothetical protein ACOX12_08755 [Eggerthellaceae bacterium]|jgi:hypothetical protein